MFNGGFSNFDFLKSSFTNIDNIAPINIKNAKRENKIKIFVLEPVIKFTIITPIKKPNVWAIEIKYPATDAWSTGNAIYAPYSTNRDG